MCTWTAPLKSRYDALYQVPSQNPDKKNDKKIK